MTASIKVLQFALETKFGKKNATNIFMLANLTINPSVAVEMILGLYTEPQLPVSIPNTKWKANLKFMSYNALEETVQYSYNEIEDKYSHTLKETGEVLMVNDKPYTESQYYAAKRVGISKDAFIEQYDSITKKVISDRTRETTMPVCDWHQ